MNNAVPEKAALEWVLGKMSPNGIIMSDDFGQYGLGIQNRMWLEFVKSNGLTIHYIAATGQGVIIK